MKLVNGMLRLGCICMGILVALNSHSQFQSTIAFTIPEKDLVPECISADSSSGKFYIGSLYKRKIIAVTSGRASAFTLPGQDGLKAVVGIRVDEKERLLYVISVKAFFIPTDQRSDTSWSSALYRFDLATGTLVDSVGASDSSIFNDLVLAGDTAYITDTYGGSIHAFDRNTHRLTEWLPKGSLPLPNGIAYARGKLFVAHEYGLSVVSVATRRIDSLLLPASVFAGGIDGLYFYQQSLIGIQNGVTPRNVLRLHLNADLTQVTRVDTLEAVDTARRYFSPTTGTVLGNGFYYISNAQVRSFNKDGSIFSPDQLEPVRIRRLQLK